MATPGTDARQELARSFMAAVFAHTEWRPVSEHPGDRRLTIVCEGAVPGPVRGRSAAAVFKGGQWVNARGKPLPFEPTHWLAVLDG